MDAPAGDCMCRSIPFFCMMVRLEGHTFHTDMSVSSCNAASFSLFANLLACYLESNLLCLSTEQCTRQCLEISERVDR